MNRSMFVCAFLTIAIASCGQPDNQVAPVDQTAEPTQQDSPQAAPTDDQAGLVPVKIANPASQNCIAHGGTLEMQREPAGQYGVCVFDDGSRCEEWRYFRGECAPGECAESSGKCE